MARKIIIRADGGKKIGMGHLYRAMLISDFMQNNFAVETILVTKDDENSLSFLINKAVKVKTIPSDFSLDQEISFITNLIHNEECSLFILDVLENDVNSVYINEIRSTNIPLAAITDDSSRRIINADVIINGNPNQLGINYDDENGKYYTGPEYFIMDDFYSRIPFDKPSEKIKTLLLTIGGSDHNDLVFKILEALKIVDYPFGVRLISSHGTGYIDHLTAFINTYNRQIKLFVDLPSLTQEWKNCDFAITAGGNSLFERIAARKPGLTICQLERQMEIADRFTTLGVNYNVGFGPDLSVNKIASEINSYIYQYDDHLIQYYKAPQFVDGKGLSRVSNIFVNLIK
jgi:UDP-2,4-diacetamido-2,4,6-trideoxy-beta-L-altropyranose hydrolase